MGAAPAQAGSGHTICMSHSQEKALLDLTEIFARSEICLFTEFQRHNGRGKSKEGEKIAES